MPNATTRGRVGTTPHGDYSTLRGAVATAQVYYPNSLVGLTAAGRLDKFDDAKSMAFVGVTNGVQAEVLSGGSAGDVEIPHAMPRFVTLAFSSIAVTDVGKTVYASDDQTGALTPGTYGNPIGRLDHRLSATSGVVECFYGGKAANQQLGAVRAMPATAALITALAQGLTRHDLNKKILVPNTEAVTLVLPAVADTQAGDTLTVVKTTADAFAITLDGNASETIDGSATLATLDAINDVATLMSDGTRWIVLSRDIS